MTWLAYPDIPGEIIPAVGRVILFILIAGVVAFLIRRTRESEKQFRGVAERSSDLILLTDAQGRARYISPSGGKSLVGMPKKLSAICRRNSSTWMTLPS